MALQIRQGKIARTLPVAVWVIAATAVGYLFVNQAQRTDLAGIAYSYEQTINSQEPGYIRYLPVSLYQAVKKGDTLAIIKENSIAREQYNSDLLKAQQATAEAELMHLKAELKAAEEDFREQKFTQVNTMAATARQLAIDVEKARLEVLEIRSTLEPEKLELKDLEVEIEIVSYLLNQGAAEEYELKKCQSELDVLKEKIVHDEELLAAAEQSVDNALQRKDEFNQQKRFSNSLTDKQLEPIRLAIVVQEKHIEELMEQFDTVVLTAPFDGIVNSLNFKPGQAVMGGEAIMTIIKPTSDYITAWIPQHDIDGFELNTKVQVVSCRMPRTTFDSQISHIGASIEQMPEVLWPSPSTPSWGRPVQIPVLPKFACIHNEIVGIKKKQ